ncbi:hypothetical protein ACP70R_021492 [Stipagrostis hirtigluma subsp. patula]
MEVSPKRPKSAAQYPAQTEPLTVVNLVYSLFRQPLPPDLPFPTLILPSSLALGSDPRFYCLRPDLSTARRFAMADEEPVDQKKYLEERCKPQCVKPLYQYEKCVKRVENDDTGHKHCTGQYFDYWSCIDKCVATKLFEKLK